MKVTFEIKEKFPVDPLVVYKAWLDSAEHSEMTGGEAECSDQEGEVFSAWDGYVTGRNIELIPGRKIVQSWRTAEFKARDEDSELIIEVRKADEGCELILRHKNIPEGQPDYQQGWIDNYFVPMKTYFRT